MKNAYNSTLCIIAWELFFSGIKDTKGANCVSCLFVLCVDRAYLTHSHPDKGAKWDKCAQSEWRTKSMTEKKQQQGLLCGGRQKDYASPEV